MIQNVTMFGEKSINQQILWRTDILFQNTLVLLFGILFKLYDFGDSSRNACLDS